MRGEKTMYDLILNVAWADERVRAVILNGSRANPEAPADKYRDYDIDKRYLPPELYSMYIATFSPAEAGAFWGAVMSACDLFHMAALRVAGFMGFAYNLPEEEGGREYLKIVK
ncbi:MAG: aminoglycoside 6-adenylyltransferase [Clostridiales bacterium]|jgi:aminoglycoside 6-adenylyltransferase|nr:aminoglycoside 6-adenylyltransferase [Clostridiales bacterium]